MQNTSDYGHIYMMQNTSDYGHIYIMQNASDYGHNAKYIRLWSHIHYAKCI